MTQGHKEPAEVQCFGGFLYAGTYLPIKAAMPSTMPLTSFAW